MNGSKWLVFPPQVLGMGSPWEGFSIALLGSWLFLFRKNVRVWRVVWWLLRLLGRDLNGKCKDSVCIMMLNSYWCCLVFVKQGWSRFYMLRFWNRNKHKAPRRTYRWSKECNSHSRLRVYECHQWHPERVCPCETSGRSFPAWETVHLYLGDK